jgi:hypothetical protein
VKPTEVVVKHSAQKLFLFERVACEMESHGVANRASTVKKIVFWLGIYDQRCRFYAAIMPQVGMLKRRVQIESDPLTPSTRISSN